MRLDCQVTADQSNEQSIEILLEELLSVVYKKSFSVFAVEKLSDFQVNRNWLGFEHNTGMRFLCELESTKDLFFASSVTIVIAKVLKDSAFKIYEITSNTDFKLQKKFVAVAETTPKSGFVFWVAYKDSDVFAASKLVTQPVCVPEQVFSLEIPGHITQGASVE